MSKSIRNLISDTLLYYREFFQRFKDPKQLCAEEILQGERNDPLFPITDVFLTVKLKDEDDEIVFADSLDTIKDDLLKLIHEIIDVSQNFPRAENTLARSDKMYLWPVPEHDQLILEIYEDIENIIDDNLENVKSSLEIPSSFNFLLKEIDRVSTFVSRRHTREDYAKEFKANEELYNQVFEEVPFFIRMNMVLVDAVAIKKKLLAICRQAYEILAKSIQDLIMKSAQDITKDIQNLLDGVSSRAESAEKLVELEANILNIRTKEHKRIVNEFVEMTKWLDIFYELYYDPNEEAKVTYNVADQVHSLLAKVDREDNRIEKDREDLEERLRKRKEEFSQQITILNNQIESLRSTYTEDFMAKEANVMVDQLEEKLNDCLEEMEDINRKEDLIGWPQTEFPKLGDAESELKPYREMWRLIRDKQISVLAWTKEKSIFKLKAEEIDTGTKTMVNNANKLTHTLNKTQHPYSHKILTDALKELKSFQSQIPLINIFCNPGLKEVHQNEITEVIGYAAFGSETEVTLNTLIELKVSSHLSRLEEISDTATKQYNIESILKKMYEEWDCMAPCEIKPWKETGTYAVSGNSVDEITLMLDDQIIKTQTMKGSPYAKFLENRITEWEDWLQYTLKFVEFWVKVQQVWLYLEPIFSSPDITKNLPVESSKFKEVDANWKTMMNKINANPKVLEFTKNRKLLDLLKECFQNLELVQKGLNSYLGGKRSNFPRFYFLSDDELLEILSETKDPLRVQPHLKKCFEGIQKLKFDEGKKIHGMYSTEGEYIEFHNQIDTMAAKGQVDEWLLNVENEMRDSLVKVICQANKEFNEMAREDWVLGRCGQAVLTMNMVLWTKDAEEAMLEKGVQGAEEYAQKCTSMLEGIVALVRKDIGLLDRCTIEALIVLDVHNRDVMQALADEGISDINTFDWQKQLRYYFNTPTVSVRIINAELKYCYEYLGNSARLVITKLTDRCYRTLCGAIYLEYGGAPEGPAGTGKTETVKDLAKALARQCVVYNCSDGLDFRAMRKFFKGLASSGAWSCFDEFNRIDLEVLSVVAQQIMTIQLAKAAGLEHFWFEDAEIKLVSTCNVFITMNPGYAGRSELPDNLKALFRAVAMMVPEYALIAEISLFSYGFSDGRNLARKIVATYKLCSEQLSSQSHYDYGMRAVKSVLVAAGNLKRKFPNENESVLMLRSINEVNLAKFLAYDLPLFRGITSDLFPRISIPEIDYKNMLEAIHEEILVHKLQAVPYFIEKTIQLYEMICVRHGLMIVGEPFSGKTSITNVLAGALTRLSEKNLELPVKTTIINPKSINIKLLYGSFDEITQEWSDGVLAVKFRQFVKDESEHRKWLIFDGPVDALWIENMNTVLDDNKKLCLTSGEIILMSKTMTLMFEPMDLLVASPATVSRCGMVYLEPAEMGWQPLFISWIEALPTVFKSEDLDEIRILFEWAIDSLTAFLRKNCHEISPTQDQNLVQSLMRIFSSLLLPLSTNEEFLGNDIKDRQSMIDHLFVFAAIWSIGATVVTDSKKPFDIYMKKLFSGDIKFPLEIPTRKLILPEKGMLYDYKYQLRSDEGKFFGEWVYWIDLIDATEVIPPKISPQEIIVKTADTVRYSFLLKQNIHNEIPTLFCGPTGTGKSLYIMEMLMNGLDQVAYSSINVGFSAQTSSTQTQDIIDAKLDRKKKGVFGPKSGKCIIFVDDLNMPRTEVWGAQPPVEILRQLLDQRGWYDIRDKEKPFKSIIDVIFLAAMGEPGGGRTFITPRILRHLHLLSLTQFDDENLNRIFTTILHWFFSNNGFSPELFKLENKVVQSTLEIYKTAMTSLLPTPSKSHYLFNLRDFSKVIMGICMSNKDSISSNEQVVKIWTHETLRVFSDRLVNEEDRAFLFERTREVVRKVFGYNFDTVFAALDLPDSNGEKDGKVDTLDEIRGLMFTDILTPIGAPKKLYEEIVDFPKLHEATESYLANFNSTTDTPMDLVLFNFAIEHLLIISRILKQPGGNALLVGVGGSGRQSLTKLASSIAEFPVFQIEIKRTYGLVDFRDDIKRLLKQAGTKDTPITFLFTDSQIKTESFVEDINNLLNSGEIPNLFPPEERVEIYETVRAMARKEGKAVDGSPQSLHAFFVEQIRKQLHIILCFSPIGDSFRNRVIMFPSLVNCCTIDWYFQWPQDALVSVAKKFLLPVQLEPEIKEACVNMVQYFHQSTIEWSEKFFNQLSRKYYVTPTSYLEMIVTFKRLLEARRKEVKNTKDKYENGFEKIVLTEKKVEEMKANLIKLQPQLKDAAVETEKKVKEVAIKKGEADKLKEAISKEEAVVQVAVDEANEIKADCEKDLAEALPILEEAENVLKVLDKNSIDEVKKMMNPPQPVKSVLQALCYLLYPNPTEKVKNQDTQKYEINWWAASLKVVGDNLLHKLQSFDKENIPEKDIAALGKFLKDPANEPILEVSKVENASKACKCIIVWINGIYKFYFVNLKVKPKKAKLAVAQEKADKFEAQLAEKQKEVKKAEDNVATLNHELDICQKKKKKLEDDYEECSQQLERAKLLIESLGGEKDRWGEVAKHMDSVYDLITGDVLIASGMIAYLGAFTTAFRNSICVDWVSKVKEIGVKGSPVFSMDSVLGDKVKIRSWIIQGLPSDSFSIENAIIMSKTQRWPLFIDPQGQANKWVKKMESSRKLFTIKLSDSDFLRTLENALQFGKPVLLENVGEDLDPSLAPILLKQTFTKGASTYIKLGDQPIEYNKDFQFYITTKLRNPHYLPEICIKVTLLNFMITFEGLDDQLLGILVGVERPNLKAEKDRLIIEGADNKKQLQEIEEKILEVLSSGKNILTDETAVKILTASKEKSVEITEKQAIADKTEKEIDLAREEYHEVSQQAACLFFAITDLGNIDPMYQYSLTYFIDLFTQAIVKSEQSDELQKRLKCLKDYFLYSLYCNICRSLFEKDKLLFSFLLVIKLLDFRKEMNSEYLRFLLTGGISLDEKTPPKPKGSEWLSDKSWTELFRLSQFPEYKPLFSSFEANISAWKGIYESRESHLMPLPGELNEMGFFKKLLVLRTLRPDKMIPAIQEFVKEIIGAKFIEPPPFNLVDIYEDSTSTSPLIFVLSPGSDPFASLNVFASQRKKLIRPISLGQGQGPNAEMMITESLKTGDWVVLQNCHLAITWMPKLERICEELSPDPKHTHEEFRLWLTSYPSNDFPTAILMNGIKMTNEPPKGLKANLIGSFMTDPITNSEFFTECSQPKPFVRLLYGLCFFHAVIQERRKYGALGWNIPYEFNESDLRICVRQLRIFLDEDPNVIPFDALKYLTAECNYGGRVTDDKDRILINTLLNDYYNSDVVNVDGKNLSEDGIYKIPEFSGHSEILEYIKKLPMNTHPNVFGFHANAEITKDLGEANLLLDSILSCVSEGASGESGTMMETLKKVVSNIQADFPEPFDLGKANAKYGFVYLESMNTVLTQELARFNILIQEIRSSLVNISKALKGEFLMTPMLEKACKSLFDGKVPELWMGKSYPSLKPLASYIADLKARIIFFNSWINEGQPTSFWISGFYFTQSFLTGVLQNYARKKVIAIDEIVFDFEIMREDAKMKADDGTYIHGLFLEGAKWNYKTHELDESDPKVLFVKCPTIKLIPCHYKDLGQFPHFECPVYKTTSRRGTLTTTGTSSNFVMKIKLPNKKPESHWVKRGVALITQLDD